MTTTDTRHNPANEVAKYKFFEELANMNDGRDPKTVDQFVNAIHEFEVAIGFKDFRKYKSDWAITFKEHMDDKRNPQTGQEISKSLYFHYISFVRRFFEWLMDNEKDYAKIKRRDIGFLSVTRGDKNKARVPNYQESHEVADILATIRAMPSATAMELRNKAIISLFLLTTPRIGSLQQARVDRIKYFKEYGAWAFVQDPRLQNTKNANNITSFFIGDSEDIIQNVITWRDCLVAEGFKGKNYLFPKITPSFSPDGRAIAVLTREYIKSDTQIREVIKEAFESNGLPYLKPHSFRHSIARKVKKEGDSTHKLIALAENMGQKSGMATIINSYAGDYLKEQSVIIKGIRLE